MIPMSINSEIVIAKTAVLRPVVLYFSNSLQVNEKNNPRYK